MRVAGLRSDPWDEEAEEEEEPACDDEGAERPDNEERAARVFGRRAGGIRHRCTRRGGGLALRSTVPARTRRSVQQDRGSRRSGATDARSVRCPPLRSLPAETGNNGDGHGVKRKSIA